MKRKTLRFLCALTAVLTLLAAASCARKLKINPSTTKIRDQKSGIEYGFVSSNYLPRAVSEEKYAVFVQNKVKVNYFTIEGLSPDEWLYSELGELIYSGETGSLPDISGFNPDSVIVAYNTDLNFTLAEISTLEETEKIVDRFVNGEPSHPTYYDHDTYKLLFSSPDYPYLYYQLWLVVTSDGTYIFDRFTQKYVEAGDLFSDVVPAYSYEDYD